MNDSISVQSEKTASLHIVTKIVNLCQTGRCVQSHKNCSLCKDRMYVRETAQLEIVRLCCDEHKNTCLFDKGALKHF